MLNTVMKPEAAPSVKEKVQRLCATDSDRLGVILLHAQPFGSNWEAQAREWLSADRNLRFELLRDAAHDILAVLLPDSALDMTHYHALQLKMLFEQSHVGKPIVCAIAAPDNPAEAESLLFDRWSELKTMDGTAGICVLHDELEAPDVKKILIVDHDDSVREFLQIQLKLQGYEVHAATDAITALDMIRKEGYDLIVTELNLYGLNGLPFISQIQKMELAKEPKIVILSEQRVGSTIEHCFQQGVSDYITKPFSPADLDARIRSCF
ncbi:response regulator [Paenibacillus thiaminolyticus]|uniref:response regulator n=1 Tax=Paenibacillus thiaminolyticus TaxID=49283 RepID=UPI00254377AD|nr:response regulator [Paenibacillus thiaminolyticus]WII38166.1 response regulator [Paenibacillus thiaminolyticus]